MELIKIITYVFFAYGACNVVVYGAGPFNILIYIRQLMNNIHNTLGKLFTCMMCLSVNLGMLLSLVNTFLLNNIEVTPFNIIITDNSLWWLKMLMDGGFTSGVVWLLHTLSEFMESNSISDGDGE